MNTPNSTCRMSTPRNIEGLQRSAQRKRQAALEKASRGIDQLVNAGKAVDFTTVALESGVSRAFLYQEPEIKARIEFLRSKTTHYPAASTDSDLKVVVTETLGDRLKKLTLEARELRGQNEILQGEAQRAIELANRVEQLEAENARLKNNAELIRQVDSLQRVNTLLERRNQELQAKQSSQGFFHHFRHYNGNDYPFIYWHCSSLQEASVLMLLNYYEQALGFFECLDDQDPAVIEIYDRHQIHKETDTGLSPQFFYETLSAYLAQMQPDYEKYKLKHEQEPNDESVQENLECIQRHIVALKHLLQQFEEIGVSC